MRYAFEPMPRRSSEPELTPRGERILGLAEDAGVVAGVVIAMVIFGVVMDMPRGCPAGGEWNAAAADILGVLIAGVLSIVGVGALTNLLAKCVIHRLGGHRCGACGRTLASRRDRCCFAMLPQPRVGSGVRA